MKTRARGRAGVAELCRHQGPDEPSRSDLAPRGSAAAQRASGQRCRGARIGAALAQRASGQRWRSARSGHRCASPTLATCELAGGPGTELPRVAEREPDPAPRDHAHVRDDVALIEVPDVHILDRLRDRGQLAASEDGRLKDRARVVERVRGDAASEPEPRGTGHVAAIELEPVAMEFQGCPSCCVDMRSIIARRRCAQHHRSGSMHEHHRSASMRATSSLGVDARTSPLGVDARSIIARALGAIEARRWGTGRVGCPLVVAERASPPQIRTRGFPASGSSGHGFAGRSTEWIAIAFGSGQRASTSVKRRQLMRRRERRDSHWNQMPFTA